MADDNQPTQTSQQPTQQLQSLFNKGFAAFERGSLDMAIDLLFHCVETSPSFLRARKFLRAAELQRAKKNPKSGFSKQLSELGGMPSYLKGMALLKTGKAERALVEGERALQREPLSVNFTYLVADAAEAAGYMDAALMTLEAAVEQMPDNADLVEHLAHAYQHAGEFRKARDAFNTLVNLRPRDADALKQLKDADARLTMESGGWESVAGTEGKKGDFRDLIKNKEQAASLDKKAKAVVAGTDADALIEEQKAKIAAEPQNLNYYRGLARLYLQQKNYAAAVETLSKAREMNPTDPELDRSLTAAKVQLYTSRIAELREKGDEAGAQAMEAERGQFVFDDLVSRVERYPNDLRLRFDLGMQYFQYESYDDAIQQFQLSQRSPKERAESLYYLARCFRAKGQKDMALMQLETALEQLPVMDDSRKQVVFELGELREEAGDLDKALVHYKEIYGADIGYRDIGAKMERVYKLRNKQ